jgi:hypothetical protein
MLFTKMQLVAANNPFPPETETAPPSVAVFPLKMQLKHMNWPFSILAAPPWVEKSGSCTMSKGTPAEFSSNAHRVAATLPPINTKQPPPLREPGKV